MAINFISSKGIDEEHKMYSKIDNTEIMAYDKAGEVTKELFKSLISRYQIGLETSMRGSNIIFDSVYLLHYKCHKINFKQGESLGKKQESTSKSH